jgi:hypothetical protein
MSEIIKSIDKLTDDELTKLLELLGQTVSESLAPVRASVLTDEIQLPRRVVKVSQRDADGVPTGTSVGIELAGIGFYRGLDRWLVEFQKSDKYMALLKGYEIPSGTLNNFLQTVAIKGEKDSVVSFELDRLRGRSTSHTSGLTAKLKGIVPKDGEVVLDKDVILRQVTGEDLSAFVLPNLGISMSPFDDYRIIPDSVLELKGPASQVDLQIRLYKIVTSFALYREAAVSYTSFRMGEGLAMGGFAEIGAPLGRPTQGRPRLVITQTDAGKISSFVRKIEPKIPRFLSVDTPIGIALKRYLDSLASQTELEERLTYAVMGLESLFLEQTFEAQFRLATRASHVLGRLNENASESYHSLLTAYKYRSKYVHGRMLAQKERPNGETILSEIWRYLRKSLLVWLFEGLSSDGDKEQFLHRVDRALIDLKAEEDLRQTLGRVSNLLPEAF